MIKLIDINFQDRKFTAKYIPEDSNAKLEVEYDAGSGKYMWEKSEEYGDTYGRMAVNGLKELYKDLEDKTVSEIPKEKIVMWY